MPKSKWPITADPRSQLPDNRLLPLCTEHGWQEILSLERKPLCATIEHMLDWSTGYGADYHPAV